MIKRFSMLALAMLVAFGCSDPISVDDTAAPEVESRRFTPPVGQDFRNLTIAGVVVAVVDASGEFSILLEALSRVDLVGAVDGNTPLTVFAPTNDAFVALLGELGATSLDDIDDETLTQVLLYHVVPGRVTAELVLGSSQLMTLQGGKLTVNAGDVSLTDQNGRTSDIVDVNIAPRNGIIHVIDTVVLP